jgi:queuosine precursor transporter
VSNELLGLCFLLVNFLCVVAVYRFFGVQGLFVWVGFSTVIANIQVVKTIEIFGLTATMGNVMYGTLYLVTDILHEKYGKEAARKAVWLGFFTLVATTLIMQFALLFAPHETDIAQPALTTIFGVLPQIAAGSLLAYMISQNTDVYLYSWFKKKFPKDNQLWIRNNGSTMISQFIDTLVFTTVAFYGLFEMDVWIDIFITTYAIKWIVALADTPFVYLAKRFHRDKAVS